MRGSYHAAMENGRIVQGRSASAAGAALVVTAAAQIVNVQAEGVDAGTDSAFDVVAQEIASVELAPTLLDWAGTTIPAEMQGHSLRPLVEGREHLVLCCVHPSPLSAYQGFFGSKPFSRIDAFLAQHPSLRRFTIPAGSYPGQTDDLPTVSMWNIIVAHKAVPAAFVVS